MNYLKSFKNIFSKKKIDNDKYFYGIDISDMHDFYFFWSNIPSISDYYTIDGQVGPSKKRIKVFKKLLVELKQVSKQKFKLILEEEGFPILHTNNSILLDRNYSIHIVGNARHFFEVITNLKYLI